jgi:hypothetical protein
MTGTFVFRKEGAFVGGRGRRAGEGQASLRWNGVGTVATYAGMVAAALLLLAALAGITYATLRYVSERSDRALWEIENVNPHEAPR